MAKISFDSVFEKLKSHGLLLQSDANLPSVSSLVAGEPVRGSWWAHPRSQEIFVRNGELEDHPDVLVTKLISGKVTYVHRALWPALISLGRSRAAWQMQSLSSAARDLLRRIDRSPIQTGGGVSKPGSELELRILVYVERFHTELGAHARRLESWDHWSERTGYRGKPLSPARAQLLLEQAVESLNSRFNARGRLPWHS